MVTVCLIGPKPSEGGGVAKAILYQAYLYNILGYNIVWLDSKNFRFSLLSKCDILHVHTPLCRNLLLILLRKPRKILTLHGWVLDEARASISMSRNALEILKNLLFYILTSVSWIIHKLILIPFMYDYVTAVSHITAKKNGVKAIIVPNSFICKNTKLLKRYSNFESNEVILVTYISIGGCKMLNLPRLIKILYLLDKRLKELGVKQHVVLHIYGKNISSTINEKISKHPFVKFMGYVNDYMEQLKKADLFLAGYTFPELGYAVLEAMCVGVPVAKFTENTELEEIVDGFNGILARSDQEMVEKLTKYILSKDEMKEKLSINAKNTIIRKRDPRYIATIWKIIIRELTMQNTTRS